MYVCVYIYIYIYICIYIYIYTHAFVTSLKLAGITVCSVATLDPAVDPEHSAMLSSLRHCLSYPWGKHISSTQIRAM